MNPLTTIPSSSLYESTQRIDIQRSSNPPPGTQDSRTQQTERTEQPASGVSVAISSAARSRASEELPSAETVNGSNATSQSNNDARGGEPGETLGRLVDTRA